ncbi:MAG TPA: phosphoribosylformylglycinamidine synthase subunit PurL, partial [Alphaproteobacteria bacterium]|nr:phosphoribosylformylglycinamidine synthase subunit PurL [Alphaproteobacteria bacterium]
MSKPMTQAAAQKTAPAPSFREPAVDAALGAKFGLKPDEYAHILKILGRTPTYTELGVFSVMWSEHCSYKSSRIHLKKLPTQAPWVIEGPGENAGVIDIGDGQAAVFKMESHNHPSYIEPYQGATTGVGGIMRDVFTMGARPIANLNALRFGSPDHPKTRTLVAGVVAGVAGYGNCMGVPTVGGETNFHPSYNGNILVNAMTVGVADTDKIYYSRGATPGQPIVYVGSKTGRDGIHGATMASAEFDDQAEAQRPTVQVGDPFTEKLLLEACLELMATDAIVCIQDMGAAGLTSSSVEIAAKGAVGVELDLDRVPMREEGMIPYEIMLSESQERMLMVLRPEKEAQARAIFEKWDLDFAVIGQTIPDRRLKLNMYGKTWCDIPVPPLVDEAPVYDRPQGPYPAPAPLPILDERRGMSHLEALKTLLACPDLASKRWIWEQYDSLVRADTVFGPGIAQTQTSRAADAALVRLEGGTKALALTSDVTPRYCQADPFEGGKQAVAE